jgi:hypothetical protein
MSLASVASILSKLELIGRIGWKSALVESKSAVPCSPVSTVTLDDPLEMAFRELYPSIQSVALIQRGGIARMLGNERMEETFVVTDVLEGGWYFVTRGESQYQLLFTVKDGYIMVNVPLDADVVDVAQKLSRRLVSLMS